MRAASFTAALPEPYRILGLTLLPLSLGRYRLLHRFDVAFVSEQESKAEIGDLILGVFICSLECRQFLELLRSDRLSSEIHNWAVKVGVEPPWWMRNAVTFALFGKRWARKHSFNVVEKIQLFQSYIVEGSKSPNYFTEEGPDRIVGAHWSHTVEVTLRSELGWSEEEIEEAPLTKALSDYFAYAESQGAVTLMTREDEAQGDANARAYARAFGLPEGSNN